MRQFYLPILLPFTNTVLMMMQQVDYGVPLTNDTKRWVCGPHIYHRRTIQEKGILAT